MARTSMEPIDEVLRVICEMKDDGTMRCKIKLKGEIEKVFESLSAVHGKDVDGSFYQDKRFFLTAPGWQSGKTMRCTNFGDDVLICQP